MWPFDQSPSKEALQGHKTIRVGGFVFKIKKINPIVDFPAEKIPQIFSSFVSRRKQKEPKDYNEAETRKIHDDIYHVIKAGLVEPRLVAPGKGEDKSFEKGVTVEDLFRYEDVGTKLYLEIIAHSLNRFRGVKGFFLLAQIRRKLLTHVQNGTVKNPLKSPSPKESLV